MPYEKFEVTIRIGSDSTDSKFYHFEIDIEERGYSELMIGDFDEERIIGVLWIRRKENE